MKRYRNTKGFTLIELLVVIAIIAILAAILFPVFAAAKQKGNDVKCLSNLRQLGLSFSNYNSDWNEKYMLAPLWDASASFPSRLKRYIKSNALLLCPSAPKANKVVQSNEDRISDPADPNAIDCAWVWYDNVNMPCHYGYNQFLGGTNPEGGCKVVTQSIIKAPSRTLLLMDCTWCDLGNPYDHPGLVGGASRRHRGGVNAVCVDGHSRLIQSKYLNNRDLAYNGPIHMDYRF